MLLNIDSIKNNKIFSLTILILFLTLFSGLSTNLFFLINHSLVGDAFSYYPYFQEHLFSLNRYGEIAWWFPHVQNGWATDFTGILSFPGFSPLFVVLSFIIWIFGKLGILIEQYFFIYILYYSFILPGILIYAVSLVSKELFKSFFIRVYIIVLVSFCPAIILQLTEMVKIESLIFLIFLIYTIIKLFQSQNRIRYYYFVLSIYSFVLSTSLGSTLFIFPFIVIMIVSTFLFIPYLKDKLILIIKKSGFLYFILFIIGFTFCFLPIYFQILNIHDFSFKTLDISDIGSPNGLKYDISKMVPGNPLEFLFSSTPGIGFEWMGYRNIYQPFCIERSSIAYIYCGFITIPFFIYGYIYSKRILKHQILFILILLGSILLLCNHSPIMAILYSFESPLLSFNHINDGLFRAGGFLIIIFGSALGLEAWLKSKNNKLIFIRIIIFWIIISLFTFLVVLFFSPSFISYAVRMFLSSKIISLYIFLSLIFILILKSWGENNERENIIFKFIFIMIVFIDVSSQAFIHISKLLYQDNSNYPMNYISEEINDSGIGFKQTSHPGHKYINSSFMMKVNRDVKFSGLDFSLLPDYGILNNYKFYNRLENRYIKVDNENKIVESSLFHNKYQYEIENYLKSENVNKKPVIKKSYKGYNKIHFNIKSSNRDVLFIKDSYSKFWEAKINSVSTKIYPAYGVFKAILIPEGNLLIELEYDPKVFKYLMFLAYSSFFVIAFLILREYTFSKLKEKTNLNKIFF